MGLRVQESVRNLTFVIIDKINHHLDHFGPQPPPPEVSKALIKKLDRGVTILNGTGAYTGEPRPVLMCILRTRQLAVATKAVKDVDPEAFIYVQDVTEVFGHRFKAPPI